MGYWDKKTPKEEEPVEEEAGTLEEFESTSLEEFGELEKSFRERMKQENKRFRDMCDTEYWFCVCFTSRAQKEEFLQKVGIDTNLKYIDGHDMAKAFRKSLKTPDLEFAKIRPFDKEYLGEVEKGFRERMKQENKRFRDMCDTEYWFCVCFTSRAQKEEFLQKVGMDTDLKYIDGHDMAKAFRKSLKTPDLEFAKVRPFDKEYLARSADFEE